MKINDTGRAEKIKTMYIIPNEAMRAADSTQMYAIYGLQGLKPNPFIRIVMNTAAYTLIITVAITEIIKTVPDWLDESIGRMSLRRIIVKTYHY